mgnify:FL=1
MLKKYYGPASHIAGIKNNTYDRRISTQHEWAGIAYQDCPGLEPDGVKVVSYLGDRWKGQAGIEWRWPTKPNDSYTEITRLEPAVA